MVTERLESIHWIDIRLLCFEMLSFAVVRCFDNVSFGGDVIWMKSGIQPQVLSQKRGIRAADS